MYEFQKQLDNAEKKLKGTGGDTDYSDKKFYERFSAEYFEYGKGGETPQNAGYDLRFFSEVKNKKLEKMGDRVIERYSPSVLSETTGISFSDKKYIFKRIFKNFKREVRVYNKRGGRKFLKKDKTAFYENIVMAIPDKIKDDDKFCCPSCGNIHKLKTLEQDCPDCKTPSFITDLFPRVISCFNMKTRALMLKDMLKTLLICCLAGIIAGIPFGVFRMISDMSMPYMTKSLNELISDVFISPLQGAAAGAAATVFIVLGQLIYISIKNAPAAAKANENKKKINEKILEYDKNFSYEYFESRVVYLAQLLIFCDERDKLLVCSLGHTVRKFNIIDSVYSGSMDVKSIEIDENICTVELEISMLDIHDNGEKVFCREDTFIMKLQKDITKTSDISFEVKNAVCAKCGESFDGWNNSICSSCQKEYHLEENDWIVKAFMLK